MSEGDLLMDTIAWVALACHLQFISGNLHSSFPCPVFSGRAGPRTWLGEALGVFEPGILYVKSRLKSHIKPRLSSLLFQALWKVVPHTDPTVLET